MPNTFAVGKVNAGIGSTMAVVMDPELEGRRLVAKLGLEWRGWPEEVFDANARRRQAQ